jgi:hypothetical protein
LEDAVMGANNADFKASALFHGTAHPFKEGDIVLPAKTAGVYSYWKAADPEGKVVDLDVDEKAYATPSLDWARKFAKVDSHTPGYVFEVEPLDNDEVETKPGTDYDEVKSRKGFRIVKQVK